MDLRRCVDEMSAFWSGLPPDLQVELGAVRLLAFPTPWTVRLRGVRRCSKNQRGLFVGQQRILVTANDLLDVEGYSDVEWEDDEVQPRQVAAGTIAIIASNLLDTQMLEHTLLHEIGHALGMSEAELHEELGL